MVGHVAQEKKGLQVAMDWFYHVVGRIGGLRSWMGEEAGRTFMLPIRQRNVSLNATLLGEEIDVAGRIVGFQDACGHRGAAFFGGGPEGAYPDRALVDFLHLPPKHSEARLRKGIVAHMKEFILSIGRDFLFVGEEFPVQVGGSDFRIDLLFFHRALRCLVAF